MIAHKKQHPELSSATLGQITALISTECVQQYRTIEAHKMRKCCKASSTFAFAGSLIFKTESIISLSPELVLVVLDL